MSRILLVSSDSAFEERVRSASSLSLNGDLRRFVYAEAQHWPHAMPDATGIGASPDVIVLGPGLPLEDALRLARRFDNERPEISVLLVAPPSPEVLEAALHAGVRDVLSPDASPADAHDAFIRAIQTAARRRANLTATGGDDRALHRVITVVSPKGGSGKTTLCSNLATGLAARESGGVAIVDLDIQFGDVASALQLTPEATIGDAARAGIPDATSLKAYLTPHSPGLYALCAPDSPVEEEDVKSSHITKIVELLGSMFQYVVIDTSAGLTEHTLAALEVSTDIVLLCAMDVPSTRSLRKAVVTLDRLGMTEQRRHFVLNRADAKVGLDPDDIEATVGLPVNVAIASSRAVPLSLNQGIPLIVSDPRSSVAKQFQGLVNRFAEAPSRRHGRARLRRGNR
ncbi:MAG TPA: AAA family ATPase [Egibacteraceae bacterium]|nr:AAA family ATPase [Egibacteraceae bacterium]